MNLFDEEIAVEESIEEEKEKKLSPFDFVNSIYLSKENLLTEENQDQYIPYIVNKALSFGKDTLFFANEMNKHRFIDKRLHYDFLMHSVKPMKRYNKWIKKSKNSTAIEDVMWAYKYNERKAKAVLKLLNDDQIKEIHIQKKITEQ